MSASENVTPTPNPSKKARPVISEIQKQALIDNLQLEVTERARKLRAQYALHAQGLQSRLEMRINRIPRSLRSVNINELIDKYSEQLEPPKVNKPLPIVQESTAKHLKHKSQATNSHTAFASPSHLNGTKRSSTEMIGSDKENQNLDLDLPKKRAKILAAIPGPSTTAARTNRTGSRKANASQVLSPKSHNSRTLPQSPIRPQMTPGKSYLARPIPISKMAPPASASAQVAIVGDKAKSTRQRVATKQIPASSTASVRGKRGIAAAPLQPPSKTTRARAQSDLSNLSEHSAGTTIVTKKSAPVRKGIISKMAGMATAAGRRAAAAKKDTQPPAETGRRVLRARKN